MLLSGFPKLRRGVLAVVAIAGLTLAVVAAVGVTLSRGLVPFSGLRRNHTGPVVGIEKAIRELEPGLALRGACVLPEDVNALTMEPADLPGGAGRVYVGTGPSGGVYAFHPLSNLVYLTIAQGLGDQIRHGTSPVNRLELRDLDGDGSYELLASTSQVTPAGRPRLYVWSIDVVLPILRAVARPAIRSNWSHGLALIERPGTGAVSAFITFCGYGEIVEYDLKAGHQHGEGFLGDALSWKVVGQLPASGEWSESADVDNDGRPEVCIATGYAEGGAAIHFYVSDGPGAELRLVHRIDEGGRFGNVRFRVGDLRGDGSREIIAWWCTDHLYGGDCEVIRYRLGRSGVMRRSVLGRGPAGELWPDDGQAAIVDLDRDGTPEVWFAAKSGILWRYDPRRSPSLARVLRIDGGLGPVAGGGYGQRPPSLFLGWGKNVLRLDIVPDAPSAGPAKTVRVARATGEPAR